MKVFDRILFHGTIIGAVALISVAVVGGATCRASVSRIRAQRREGVAFGARHSWSECISEAIRRVRSKTGSMVLSERKAFLRACLLNTVQPKGACADVPGRGPIRPWARDLCADAGVQPGTQTALNCEVMMPVLQESCGVFDGLDDAGDLEGD